MKNQPMQETYRREVVLENGLIRRTFRVALKGTCVAFDNQMTGEALQRAARSEAIVRNVGKEYAIGGLMGQPDMACLNRRGKSRTVMLERDYTVRLMVTVPAKGVTWFVIR